MASLLCAQLSTLRISARVSIDQFVGRRWGRPAGPGPRSALAPRPGRPCCRLSPCIVLLCSSRWHGVGSRAALWHPCCRPACLLQAAKPFAAAQRLASSANGIAAAPRPVLAARSKQQQQQAAAPALEVVAADGPRGMKLKSRKARLRM